MRMRRPVLTWRIASFTSCLLLSAHAPGQKEPEPQPVDVDFGTLRQDTRVESNFVVFWHDQSKVGKQAKVEPPPFVQVLRTKHGEHVRRGLYTRVWFAIATKKAGALKGSFRVVCDGSTARVPVKAVVLPRSPLSTRVLIANTPFSAFSSSDSSKYAAWRRVVDTGKLEVHYLNAPDKGPVLSVELLQRVDVVLVARSGLLKLTDGDVKLLQGFVSGGGRLVVAADYFFRATRLLGSVTKANELLIPFGLQMDNEELGGGVEAGEDDIVKHALTEKVETVKVHRPTPTRVIDPKRAQKLVKVFPEWAFIALSRTESGGEIVALGKSLWWHWAAEAPDNSRLLRNLLTRKRNRTR
jgi:hypothetical protein